MGSPGLVPIPTPVEWHQHSRSLSSRMHDDGDDDTKGDRSKLKVLAVIERGLFGGKRARTCSQPVEYSLDRDNPTPRTHTVKI